MAAHSEPARLSTAVNLRKLQMYLSLAGISLLIFIAVFAPLISPYDPLKQFTSERELEAPGPNHWMGTDAVGRDVFSRILNGTRLSLTISVAVLAISLSIGLTVGAAAGLAGGLVDEVLMRVTDIFFAVPFIILAMAVVATLGRGVNSLVIAMGVIWWPNYARLVRGQVLSIRERPFVEAARVIGNSSFGLAIRHVLPQTFPELLVRLTLDVGNVVLVVSGLSFLGLGAQPPTPEWGAIIGEGRPYSLSAPWIMIYPGLAIVFTILCFSLLGDSLQDSLQPSRATRRK